MSEELRPCPFCGGVPERGFPPRKVRCFRSACLIHSQWFIEDAWNTRPVEDALRADLARKDEVIAALEELVGALERETYAIAYLSEAQTDESAYAEKIEADVQNARAKLAEVRERNK